MEYYGRNEMDIEQTGGHRDFNEKLHVLMVDGLIDETTFIPGQQLEAVHTIEDPADHRTEKKGTYRRKRDDRKSMLVVGTEQAGVIERKRQLPVEIEVDNLSPKS